MHIAAGQPGSCNDGHVIKTTRIWQERDKYIPPPYFLVGDSGYALSPYIVVPLPGDHPEGSPGRVFNYRHSGTRIIIECAFGRLKMRFRILNKSNWARGSIDTYVKWFLTCCILHNLAITYGDAYAPLEEAGAADGNDDDPIALVLAEDGAMRLEEAGGHGDDEALEHGEAGADGQEAAELDAAPAGAAAPAPPAAAQLPLSLYHEAGVLKRAQIAACMGLNIAR